MLQDQSRNRTPMPAAQQAADVALSEPRPSRAEAGIAQMLKAPAPPIDDDELIEIGRQWPRLVAEYEGLSKRLVDMERQHPEPKRPKELEVCSFDRMHDFPRTGGTGGAFMPYGAKEVEQLRAVPRVAVYLVKKGDGYRRADGTVLSIHEAAQQRAEAIIAAWDRWQAELEAYRAAHGLPVLDAAFDAATKAYDAAILLARALPAHTLEGLMTKAKIAAEICRTKADEDDDPLDETAILQSLLADVLRIGEQPDPIHAGIANTRQAIGHALAVLEQHRRDNRDADLPPAWFEACDAAQAAFQSALTVTPTTQAGWQELARLTLDMSDDLGMDAKEEAFTVLQRMVGNTSSADVRSGQ